MYLIYYSGKLALKDEIEIGNFFSFLAAMMLAYQPVRALSTLNMVLNQGLSAASRILPIIDRRGNSIITNYSYLLKKGDIIKTSNKIFYNFEKNIKKKCSFFWLIIPKYLQINYKIFYIIYTTTIKRSDFSVLYPFWMDFNLLLK